MCHLGMKRKQKCAVTEEGSSSLGDAGKVHYVQCRPPIGLIHAHLKMFSMKEEISSLLPPHFLSLTYFLI